MIKAIGDGMYLLPCGDRVSREAIELLVEEMSEEMKAWFWKNYRGKNNCGA